MLSARGPSPRADCLAGLFFRGGAGNSTRCHRDVQITGILFCERDLISGVIIMKDPRVITGGHDDDDEIIRGLEIRGTPVI